MLPKDDASHDKTCQGSSSLKRMTDLTPAPAVSGLSLAIMLESKFSEGCPGHPRTPLGSPCDLISAAPGVWEICWSARSKFQPSSGTGETLLRALAHQWAHVLLQGCTPEYLTIFRAGNHPDPRAPAAPTFLHETRKRCRFGRVNMTCSYFCMSTPHQRVQYRLPDCNRNADLSASVLLDFKATAV